VRGVKGVLSQRLRPHTRIRWGMRAEGVLEADKSGYERVSGCGVGEQ
jgi:hypothetical protein